MVSMGFLTATLAFCLLLGSTASLPTDFEYECSNLPDNFLYWWACGSYGVCRGGQYVQVDCVNGTIYDRRAGDCVPNTEVVSFPCNSIPRQCESYNGPGQRYADQEHDPVESLPPCTFYFTCSYGRYLGHQRCSEGTVYDEPQQRCLPPAEVASPCGTMPAGGRPLSIPGDTVESRQMVHPVTDPEGKPDQQKWPFTNNNRNPRSDNRAQRLNYRSVDKAAPQTNFNPNNFNPSEYGIHVDGNDK
ncbi:uncharacterized protein LOC131945777 [Physella acuta]|uniref:uncharacterized protein LOC131945777 n=1 Tax=Physella acuta TaxID=109671 RepID=UPI0027DCC370|nr:uncharacterized protein LOC131945777 [Physella acuta]